MFSSIRNNFLILAFLFVLVNIAHADQVCRICLANKVVKFELWSTIDQTLLETVQTSAECSSAVPVNGVHYSYNGKGGKAYVTGPGFAQNCVLNAGQGDDSIWTRCCNIAHEG